MCVHTHTHTHTYLTLTHSVNYLQLFATPWTIVHKASLFMVLSRQAYWYGLPFPLPGDLPDSGIKPEFPMSPVLAGGFFTTAPPWKPYSFTKWFITGYCV